MSTTPVPPYGTTGAFTGIDILDYHHGAGASRSSLQVLMESPWKYHELYLSPDRPRPTERKGHLEGNLLHTALLEPQDFGARYFVVPEDAPKRPSVTQLNAKKPSAETIAAIDFWQKLADDNIGKVAISAEQYTAAWKQADSLRRIQLMKDAMKLKGHAERSLYATDPETGVWIKARPDHECELTPYASMFIDAKTTGSASPSEFARTAAQKRYHVQGAHYRHTGRLALGRTIDAFVFAAVETEWPYAANVMELGPQSLAAGERVMRAGLQQLAACHAYGTWPDYSRDGGATKIELPTWAEGMETVR